MGFKILLIGRSLWLDEALLAQSITTRGFHDLVASKLDLNQTAPVLYLYSVKIIVTLFGNNEFTLRLFSYISFIGSLILIFLILKTLFPSPKKSSSVYCYLGMTIFSMLGISLRYATELKPYMSDAFFTLAALYLYLLFLEKTISFIKMSCIYAILLWASSPVSFIIAAIMTCEFFSSLIRKDYKYLKTVIFAGIIVLMSFSANYFLWLREVAVSDSMTSFWKNSAFPLIPRHMEDFKKIASLYAQIANSFGSFNLLYSVLSLLGVIALLYIKSEFSEIALISALLLIIASSIGKYPISARLMIFSLPVFIIFICAAVKCISMTPNNLCNQIIHIFLAAVLLASSTGWRAYYKNPYVQGEEANELIAYAEQNIDNDELLYVYTHSLPVFDYKNHYKKYIGVKNTQKRGNIIFGTSDFESDIEKIEAGQTVYMLFSHFNESRIALLIDGLNQRGFFELVMLSHNTPLYFFTTDISKAKTKAEYELIETDLSAENQITVSVKAANTGGAVWAEDEHNKINLVIRSTESADRSSIVFESFLATIDGNIFPGEEIILKGTAEIPSELTDFEIELVREDKYRFRDIGVPPIKISK